MAEERIDITEDFYRAEKKNRRKQRRKEFFEWCGNHMDVAIAGLCAGLGLVTTGIKVGGRIYKQHAELKSKDLRRYDTSLGRYWELRRKLTNKDWLEIDRRKAMGERLGDILESLHALK